MKQIKLCEFIFPSHFLTLVYKDVRCMVEEAMIVDSKLYLISNAASKLSIFLDYINQKY